MQRFAGAVAAVLLVAGAARADKAAAVKAIEKLGGKIERDEKQPGKPVVKKSILMDARRQMPT